MDNRKGVLRFIATIKRHYIDNKTKMCVLSLADEAEDKAGDSYQGFAYTKLLGNGGLSLSHTQSLRARKRSDFPFLRSVTHAKTPLLK